MMAKIELTGDVLARHAKEIEAIMRRAVAQALLMHKRLRNPIATWKDGHVVIIPPEEIPVDDEGNYTC